MMFENKLQQELNDVNYRVELYRQELIENNVCNNEADGYIKERDLK